MTPLSRSTRTGPGLPQSSLTSTRMALQPIAHALGGAVAAVPPFVFAVAELEVADMAAAQKLDLLPSHPESSPAVPPSSAAAQSFLSLEDIAALAVAAPHSPLSSSALPPSSSSTALRIYKTHGQQVSAAPPGAAVVCRSASAAIEVCRLGSAAGCQVK